MAEKKKKIAFFIGSLSHGGAERVISALSNALADQYNVLIIPFVAGKPFYPLSQHVKVSPCLKEIKPPTNFIHSLKLNYSLLNKASRILKNEQVDVAIGFITTANIIAILASKINGIPCIICERNNPLIEYVPRFWKLLRKITFPWAARLIIQTEGVKKYYEDHQLNRNIHILPNPIDSKILESIDSSIPKKNIVLTVGRLDKNKGQDVIIRAFAKLTQKNWHLVIAGDGNHRSELVNLIDELNLKESIHLVGAVQNIQEYYNKAKIFVLASRTEGFPNVLLEAMAFGLPCISTNCPNGPSELIADGINGYLIPVDDVKALEERLFILMNDPDIRYNLGVLGKKTSAKYHLDSVKKEWKSVISDTLN